MRAMEQRMACQKCTLGCPIFDKALNGGIPCRSITELVGESSAAKTQLCLQLLLAVQLPVAEGGLEGSALYIYTENYFASSRLRQLAAAQSIAARAARSRSAKRRPWAATALNERRPVTSVRSCFERVRLQDEYSVSYDVFERPAKVPTIDATEWRTRSGDDSDPCKNIYVQGLQTAEQLVRYLEHAETLLAHPLRMPVRLLVIDSIAALFRTDFTNSLSGLEGRAHLFFQISSKLKQLAEKYNVAVVVSNQVTDYFEQAEAARSDPAPGSAPNSGGSENLMTSGRRVRPALGISWAHCVNSRIFLSRVNPDPNTICRSMQVVFAPHLRNVSCPFLVDGDGVRGLLPHQCSEDYKDYGGRIDFHYTVDGAPTSDVATAACHFPVDGEDVHGLTPNQLLEDSHDLGERLDHHDSVDGALTSDVAAAAVNSADGDSVADKVLDVMAMDDSPVTP